MSVRSQETERQQLHTAPETGADPRPPRRKFAEPMLVKHEPVTRIHLISDNFGGTGSSGATFF